MSTRHYASDVDDIDELTYRMLDSRFCKVAQHGQRHHGLRHQREHSDAERLAQRKPRRPRARPEYQDFQDFRG